MKHEIELLTDDEIRLILATCRDTTTGLRDRGLIALLAATGARISEALALRLRDVSFERGEVTIHHGKGDKRRVVGLLPRWEQHIRSWIVKREALGIDPRFPLFCATGIDCRGRPLLSGNVRMMLRGRGRAAKIGKRVHPHGFRHTHAALLARSGLPLNVVQRQLGHHSLVTTSRYIDHLCPEEVVAAVRGIG